MPCDNSQFPSCSRRSSIQNAILTAEAFEDAERSRALRIAPVMRASPVGAHTYAEDTDTDTTGDTGGEPSVTAAPTAADGAKAGAESVAGPSLFLDPRLNGYMSRLGMTMVYHRKNYFVGGCLQTNSNVPVTGLFVKEVVVDAGIHLLVWLGPLVAVVVSALQAQIIYARTSGVMVPGLVDGSNAGRIEWHAKDKYYYPSYVLIVWICAVSSAIALIILVHGVTGNNIVAAAAGCTPFVEPKTHEVPESQRWKMVCSNSEGAFKAGDTSFTHHRHTMPCTHHITTQAQPACPKHLPAVTALCTQFDANVGCLGHPDGVPPPVAFGRANGVDLGLARWLALAAAPTYESLDPRRWNPTDCCLG